MLTAKNHGVTKVLRMCFPQKEGTYLFVAMSRIHAHASTLISLGSVSQRFHGPQVADLKCASCSTLAPMQSHRLAVTSSGRLRHSTSTVFPLMSRLEVSVSKQRTMKSTLTET